MANYWVVGANFSGDDMFDSFTQRGYWFLGWTDEEQPAQAAARDQIKIGDRISIKRMLGQGSPNIEIRAIGTVTDIDLHEKRIYIHWANTDLHREVPSKGCYSSIHGPFAADDDWTRKVFLL